MTWQDMRTYWAWRGAGSPLHEPPTIKRREYAVVSHGCLKQSICCGVWDDGLYSPLNIDQIGWHEAHGAKVTWPAILHA